jgi:hypothetical protein
MTKLKILLTLVLILCISQISFAEKRKGRLSMKDLTDPNSPSFVPIPYPVTEKEVIEDLKYTINKEFVPEVKQGYNDPHSKVMANLLEDKPVYKIHRICKVKNLYSKNESGFNWLIFIINKDGTEALRVVVSDTGRWFGSQCFDLENNPKKPPEEEEILAKVSSILNMPLSRKDVSKMEMVSFPPLMGGILSPAWEITLNDGKVYYNETHYLNSEQHHVYKVKKHLKWEKDSKGFRPFWRDMVSVDAIFSFDEVNDKMIIYEEIKGKK